MASGFFLGQGPVGRASQHFDRAVGQDDLDQAQGEGLIDQALPGSLGLTAGGVGDAQGEHGFLLDGTQEAFDGRPRSAVPPSQEVTSALLQHGEQPEGGKTRSMISRSSPARCGSRFFADIQAGKPAHEPQFKKKGRCRDSFYIANDKFRVDGKTIRLPKIGEVAMAEALRFEGKILGATISRIADRWFVAIQVEVPNNVFRRRSTGNGTVGVDLGVKAAATLSGETIEAPKPLKVALRRMKIRGRRGCMPALPMSERISPTSSRFVYAAKTKR
jgi:hypothetical protein